MMINECNECESLLFDFHEGKLNADTAAAVDSHLQQCDECSASLSDIWQMSLVATRWQDQQPGKLDHRSTFFASSRSWQFPQVFATAASVLALVIVLTDTHFVANDDGISLRLGRDYVSENQLMSFQAQQASTIESHMQTLTAQQVASSQFLLRSVLDTSRKERREDFSTLVTYWNASQAQQYQQTEDDLRFLIASQAEDEKDIRQLSDAFREIRLNSGNDM
jgi:hypothetical protein